MKTFTLTEAKAQLGRLIELVEAGEKVAITKRGRPVARLVPSTPPHQQLPSLADFRAGLPQQSQPAGKFMRDLRDNDRY